MNIIIFYVYISLGPLIALHLKYNTLVNYKTSDTALCKMYYGLDWMDISQTVTTQEHLKELIKNVRYSKHFQALEVSRQDQLIYVGHSMGTTSFWVMMNWRPWMNQKVDLSNVLWSTVHIRVFQKNTFLRK